MFKRRAWRTNQEPALMQLYRRGLGLINPDVQNDVALHERA
jgi:hypothetical protein